MKKVLIIYWRYTEGIRIYGLITICCYATAFIFRDILRPYALGQIIDVLPENDSVALWHLVALFAVVQIGSQIFFRSADFINSVFEARHMKILRNVALEHVLKHSSAFFANTYAGSLVAKQKRFVQAAELLFDELLGQYLYVCVQIIGTIWVLSSICTPVALGVGIWTITYFGYIIINSKKRLSLSMAEAAEDSKVTGAFADVIGNISLVKMFGSRKHEEKRFHGATVRHYEALLKAWNFANRSNVIQGLFSIVVHVGSIAAGAYLWSRHELSTGGLVLVTTYAGQLSGCLWDFGRSVRRCSKAVADAQEMVEIIELEPGIIDMPNALQAPRLDSKDASVSFNNVTFAYPKCEPVFKNFSLEIPAGQKVAVIGTSGAGKTTLVQMLLRNVDIHQGTIFVGGYNIATDLTQDGLKTLISCVSQNVDMFNRDIQENIAYGSEHASFDEVASAAEKARIHEFIMGLEYGYDTLVGERGIKLSGGQRQRVAIARALVHDAPILILDEATSSLDNVTEKEVQSILENGLKDKTVIVIAHRLSTIRNCDRILVFDNGRIAQDGTHESLLSDIDGIYYRMLHSHEVAV